MENEKNELSIVNNEMMVADDDEKLIMDLTAQRHTAYCSMVANTQEDKVILFNATNNPEKRLKDMINMELDIKDVFVEIVECKDTYGSSQKCPRVVLIDKAGVGYQCVSVGVFSALKKIFAIFGEPTTWKKPLKLKVSQISKGDRSILTLNL